MLDIKKLETEIATLSDSDQMLVIDFIQLLKQRQLKNTENSSSLDLEHEPFVGMWAGREEMQDSGAWVRQIRKEQWGH